MHHGPGRPRNGRGQATRSGLDIRHPPVVLCVRQSNFSQHVVKLAIREPRRRDEGVRHDSEISQGGQTRKKTLSLCGMVQGEEFSLATCEQGALERSRRTGVRSLSFEVVVAMQHPIHCERTRARTPPSKGCMAVQGMPAMKVGHHEVTDPTDAQVCEHLVGAFDPRLVGWRHVVQRDKYLQ